MPSLTCPTCGYVEFPDVAGDDQTCPVCHGDLVVYAEDEVEKPARARPRVRRQEGEPPAGVSVAGRLWTLGGAAGLVLGVLFVWVLSSVLLTAPWGAEILVFGGVALVVFHYGLNWVGHGVCAGRPRPVALAGWLALLGSQVFLGAFVGYIVGVLTATVAPPPGGFAPVPTDAPGVGFGMFLAILLAFLQGAILAGAMILLWQSNRYDVWQRGERSRGEWGPEAGRPPYPAAIRFAAWAWLLAGLVATIGLTALESWLSVHAPRRGPLGTIERVGTVFQVASWLVTASYLGLLLVLGRLPETLPISVVMGVLLLVGVGVSVVVTVPPLLGPTGPGLAGRWWPDFAAAVGGAVLTLLCLAAAVAGVIGDAAYRAWRHGGRPSLAAGAG